jgi:hypothetical protein
MKKNITVPVSKSYEKKLLKIFLWEKINKKNQFVLKIRHFVLKIRHFVLKIDHFVLFSIPGYWHK